MRVGLGYDVHKLVEGRKLIIGGVNVPHEKGLLGHSDADVLIHAVMDSILGALALGDIGKHFPDTDEKYKDADSMKLLEFVYNLINEKGYGIGNIDCTIIAQSPKMAPHIENMRKNIYGIIVLSSIFTTAVSLGASFLQNVTKNRKSYQQIAQIMCITGVAVSKLGFSNLVNLLYPIFGFFGIIQIIILFKNK